MARSSSVESNKSSKRKGARSVSTLTPSQLARKRANDREAQRAIRARTKEHIERLERELDDLRGRQNQSRDEAVQDLLRRNRALEEELRTMRESLGIPHHHGHHGGGGSNGHQAYAAAAAAAGTPRYEDHLSLASSGLSSRASSFGHHSPEYAAGTPDFSSAAQYVGTPTTVASDVCDSWATGPAPPPPGLPGCSVASSVSSPSPSSPAGGPGGDEYVPSYIPTSVPASMVDGSGMVTAQQLAAAQQQMAPLERRKAGDVVDGSDVDRRYAQTSAPYLHQPQQQGWGVYPVYYTQSPPM